ncbi:hypothetical protein BGZ98_008614 [Dissophora globulifera]|nr:hypothetical protein BGZ98_008614 [Dissophora globulifera]
MAILKSIPLDYTYKQPILDVTYRTHQQQQPLSPAELADQAERGHASVQDEDLGSYPTEALQLRTRTLQDYITLHYPPTFVYLMSLAFVVLVVVAVIIAVLLHHASDSKPWLLTVIAVVFLIFICKMSFISRMEKAHKGISALLQSINDQDMPNYGVLYRLRPWPYDPTRFSFIIRCANRLNLGLPCYAIELTTMDHIDEHSFQEHPATDPHASPEDVLARDNELPTYRPKEEVEDARRQEIVLVESLPPKYQDVVVDIDTISPASAPAPAASVSTVRTSPLENPAPLSSPSTSASSSPSSSV